MQVVCEVELTESGEGEDVPLFTEKVRRPCKSRTLANDISSLDLKQISASHVKRRSHRVSLQYLIVAERIGQSGLATRKDRPT